MATAKVLATATTSDWTDVIGSAASVAGVTWQNLGPADVFLAFQTAKPGTSDPYVVLKVKDAFYDKNGSAHVWAKATASNSALAAIAD